MNIERLAERATRAGWHAALSDGMRLAVVDELAIGDKSPGELQDVLGLSSNLLSHHLKVLQDARIVARRRSEGDRRRTYLTLTDRTALGDPVPSIDADRVLFVCSANSARSQLAAALWTRVSTVPVASAGTRPAEQVAAGARAVAERQGLSLVGSGPQQFAAVSGSRDLVVAVCDNAYEELGDAVSVHWSVPDPVRAGDEQAFDAAFAEISRRVGDLAPRLLAS
jgi:protein-tyrosine-phosphatase